MGAEIRLAAFVSKHLPLFRNSRTRLVLALPILTLSTLSLPTHAQPPPSINPGEYHIEATILAPWKTGAKRLTENSFAVVQDGQQYPVRISQPAPTKSAATLAYPTHLLVIFPPDAPRPSAAAVVKKLSATFSQGWLLSVTRPDGEFTPYCNSVATLSSALATGAATPISTQQANGLGQAAVVELENFPGRRVLLFSGDLSSAELPAAYNGGNSHDDYLVPQLYFVDGGAFKRSPVVDDVTTPHEIRWMGNTPGSPVHTDVDGSMQRMYEGGTAHEVTFSRAVRDALRDAHNYYDLEFAVPVSRSHSTGPVALTLFHLSTTKVSAELYTVTLSDANNVAVETRTAQPLQVKRR